MEKFDKTKVIKCVDKSIFVNEMIINQLRTTRNSEDSKPGIIALDADGTIVNMKNGDHWFTLIHELPQTAQNRIYSRVKLLGRSKITYEQQYLSASSLYEFMLNGWTQKDINNMAKNVKLREGVVELINDVQAMGYKVVVISHGIKEVLQKVLEYNSLSNIDVYANSIMPEIIARKVEDSLDFIPNFEEMPTKENNPEEFNNFVESMIVVPNTKGIILEKLLLDFKDRNSIAVGDSEGDIELFTQMNKIGGYSILHLHNDKPNKYINSSEDLNVFVNVVSHFSVNMVDSSFSPVTEIINSLTKKPLLND